MKGLTWERSKTDCVYSMGFIEQRVGHFIGWLCFILFLVGLYGVTGVYLVYVVLRIEPRALYMPDRNPTN